MNNLKKTGQLLLVATVAFSSLCAQQKKGAQQVFSNIHDTNYWGSKESVSGMGSTMKETVVLRAELPKVLAKYGIKSLLDSPCGDYNWMRQTDLGIDAYIGADIVPHMIERNNNLFQSESRTFIHADITKDELPQVDAIFCRDCIQHLPINLTFDALRNFKSSGAKFLLITTYPNTDENIDCKVGGYRKLNLEIAPFNFPKPLMAIVEGLLDKHIAVWRFADLDLGDE